HRPDEILPLGPVHGDAALAHAADRTGAGLLAGASERRHGLRRAAVVEVAGPPAGARGSPLRAVHAFGTDESAALGLEVFAGLPSPFTRRQAVFARAVGPAGSGSAGESALGVDRDGAAGLAELR